MRASHLKITWQTSGSPRVVLDKDWVFPSDQLTPGSLSDAIQRVPCVNGDNPGFGRGGRTVSFGWQQAKPLDSFLAASIAVLELLRDHEAPQLLPQLNVEIYTDLDAGTVSDSGFKLTSADLQITECRAWTNWVFVSYQATGNLILDL